MPGGWHRTLARRAAGVACTLCVAAAPAGADTWTCTTAADWSTWSFAPGTAEISSAGLVRPRYYRKNINACLDAPSFSWVDKQQQRRTGGIKSGGSNAGSADRAIDGDPATSWGPSRGDPPESWWLEVDLGRLVTATKVVVQFAADADPFEEFTIYASDGTPAFASASVTDAPDYQVVASVTKANREHRLEFELRDAYNSDVPHRSVRSVHVQLTAWRDPQTRPRLAELEVIALGDNVVLGARERGGDVAAYSAGGVAANAIDGDGVTFWDSSRWYTFPEAHWYLHLDLGARFWIDTIVLITYPPGILGVSVTPPVHHTIEVSEGTPQPGMAQAWAAKGPYVWTEVDRVAQNPPAGADRPLYVLTTAFAPRKVARIFYDHLTPQNVSAGNIRVRELQAYGEGYIPKAALQSELIDLGAVSAISRLEWAADTPPETGVEIRTRTGDTIIEETKYFTADGQEVRDRNNSGSARDEYEGLPPFRRGAIQRQVKAGAGWSSWSRPYVERSGSFLSPSPRRYVQIEAALATDAVDAAATLDRIQLSFFRPLARSVVGEIAPVEVAAAGEEAVFTYYLRPTFTADNRGFDELLVLTPSPAQLLAVRVAGQPIVPDSVRVTPDSLWVRLPVRQQQGSPLLEVQFRCAVLLNGTPLEAFVGLAADPGALQRVDAGDAWDGVDSQSIVVGTPIESALLEWTGPATVVCTPNADGHNDACSFEFLIHKINVPCPLGVRVFDLRGRPVWERGQMGAGGRYRLTWDARDAAGELVPPGLYLARVWLESAQQHAVVHRVVSVAY